MDYMKIFEKETGWNWKERKYPDGNIEGDKQTFEINYADAQIEWLKNRLQKAEEVLNRINNRRKDTETDLDAIRYIARQYFKKD